MTTQSYPSLSEAVKNAKPAHNFEVIAGGIVHKHIDFVTASHNANELNGRLYRIVRDSSKPREFLRVAIEPLPADVAKVCINRVPRMPEVKRCVPIFGR